jgi:hypothetical protein
VVDKKDPIKAKHENVLVLAGDTNVIKGSTNEDHSSQVFFKVSYDDVSMIFGNK